MSIRTIQNWRGLLEKSRTEIMRIFAGSDRPVEENVGYEKLQPLDAMYDPAFHPATFYFSGERVAMIYIRERTALNKVDPADILAAWGSGVALDSRAGEEMTHLVYPEQGVAFTLEEEDIRFLEIFPPMTIEQYKAKVYEDPGIFIK